MEIAFVKLTANGNDFVVIDEYQRTIIPDEMKGQFAALFCDRHFGIGADGILFLSRSEQADLRMRLFQPDASEAEMCGNGIRCFAKYALDAGYVQGDFMVETLAGIIRVTPDYADDLFSASITMPSPRFDRKEIPATGLGEYHEKIEGFDVYAVTVGVPHAIIIVPDADAVALARIGPVIRHHETFPNGANVDIVQVIDRKNIRIRTFERGVEGETLSCGTGAAASAVIAHRLDLVGEQVEVETNGGPLSIFMGDEVRADGPATTVFSGLIEF
jgi:diaminopimelate epimerase